MSFNYKSEQNVVSYYNQSIFFVVIVVIGGNRPFPSPPGPLFQNEGRCSAFDMEIIFILMQIKLIFTRKVVHLASF